MSTTMSSSKKIIAIVGATGNQGSSVARTFSSLSTWHVRALTRDPTSDKAKVLAALPNIELVQADLTNPSSLSQAFQGAHAIFVNTDFWETFIRLTSSGSSPDDAVWKGYETEVSFGTNAARAAAQIPTLERFVYSALGPMARASGGKYSRTMHWEGKAAIVDFINDGKECPGLKKKTSVVYLGAYNTNQLIYPRLDEQTGEWTLAVALDPSFRMPIIDPARSTGPFVRCMVEDEGPGVNLLAYDTDSYLTIEEALNVWKNVTGRKAAMKQVTVKELHEMTKAPMEVLETLGYLDEYGYMAGVEGWIEPPKLKNCPKTQSFEGFLKTRMMDNDL